VNAFPAIYPDTYPPYQSFPNHDSHVSVQVIHQPRTDHVQGARIIQRCQPAGGRLLDIGCGGGDFLRVLRQQAPEWQLMGIEPGRQAVTTARQMGLSVQQGTLETASLPYEQWDAITLWHVLEHVPDPLHTLRQIRQKLAPDGRLYLAVPICDSWDAALFGRYWIGWDLPRHFVLFEHNTLRAMLMQAGFRICHQQALDSREAIYFVTESLRWLMQERIPVYTLRRLGFAVSYARPFRWALRPYVWITALLRRSTELIIVAESTEQS
jgi:2-polyprenyl-3-methyl-5-hydroxy-6-metoxy-1,4-benzoquinol methylase